MKFDDIVVSILDKLNLFYDDPIRSSRKKLPDMSAGLFITLILEGNTGPEVSKIWGVGEQTVNRTIQDKLTPIIGKANGGGETLRYILLASISCKKCSNCNSIKKYTEYHKDRSDKHGIATICKECKSLVNKQQYLTECTKLAHKTSYKYNRYKISARNIKYKYFRSLRVPSWSETENIKQFYKNCPKGCHVDHILPLLGKYVSGLHTLSNLQYLSKQDNLLKSNKYTPE